MPARGVAVAAESGGVAPGRAGLLQAVPASRHPGPTDRYPAGQAAGPAPAAGDAERRGGRPDPRRVRPCCGTGSCSRCWPRPGCGSGRRSGCGTSDFVSRRTASGDRARGDNANGARAKCVSPATVPVSAPLVRLYSDYMHTEYGELDSRLRVREPVVGSRWAGRCATRRSPSSSAGSGPAPASSSRRTCCATPGRPN